MENLLSLELPQKIELVESITVSLPFVTPFSTSNYTWSCKEALLLSITCNGETGWGECVADPDPYYSPETTISAHYIIKKFILPQIKMGMTFGEFVSVLQSIRGNMMAKATVENAMLDLMAKLRGIPLYELLGLKKKKIMSGISIGIQNNINDLITGVEKAQEKNYHRVKLKIKKGKDVEWIRTIRKHFPDVRLMADANGDYTLDDADHLRKLDEYNLMMIEQPLSYSDIYQHSLLQKHLKTDLCLDESIHSLEDTKTAHNLGACRIINIKQGRVGGMYEALRIAKYCSENGMKVWSGGMDETGIGRAFNLHLQASEYFTLPGDTSETLRYFNEDIVEPSVILDDDGFIAIPDGPGIGTKILAERIKKFSLYREVLPLPY